MKVNWFDDVELKDGRIGCVIEIYKSEEKTGYEIELSNRSDYSETIVVTIEKIKKVLRKN